MSQVIGVDFIGAGSVASAQAKVMQRLDTKAGIVKPNRTAGLLYRSCYYRRKAR